MEAKRRAGERGSQSAGRQRGMILLLASQHPSHCHMPPPPSPCRTTQGYYFSGDGARRDADGYYWITGRVDDVINVSGHRCVNFTVKSVAHQASRRAGWWSSPA